RAADPRWPLYRRHRRRAVHARGQDRAPRALARGARAGDEGFRANLVLQRLDQRPALARARHPSGRGRRRAQADPDRPRARLAHAFSAVRGLLSRLAGLFRRPAPGRFSLSRKSSMHGFLSLAAAPPWREYLLYLPRGIEAIKRPPLVVWIHGCRQEPEAFAAGARIARMADACGFVALLP